MPQAQTVELRPLRGPQGVPAVAKCPAPRVMVPLQELFTARFLARRTRFTSLASFVAAGGLQPVDLLALDPRSAKGWDEFVRRNTDFPDWRAMVQDAWLEWVIGRLGIIIDG